MSDRTPTMFNRLATGDIRDANTTAHVPQVWSTEVAATNSANNPVKHIIRGEFQTTEIVAAVLTAANASAKTITVGVAGDVSAFAEAVVSAGGDNERFVQTPASGNLTNWLGYGSAAAITTVIAYWTDVSGLAASGYLTHSYIQKA